MTMQFYIYIHCRPDGTPFYVGKGCGKRSHDFARGRNGRHRNIVAKYGAPNIGVFVFPCESERQALDDEIRAIKQLRADGCVLANLTDGGEGTSGRVHSEAARKKMSAAKMGKTPHNFGKSCSTEARGKMSAARKGNVALAEHCAKLSVANALRVVSAETRAKMSAVHTGRKLGAETRARIAASKRGKPRPDLAARNRSSARRRAA